MKKYFFCLSLVLTNIFSCDNNNKVKTYYASVDERVIIEKMTCWESALEKALTNGIAFSSDKDKTNKYIDDLVEENKSADKLGQDQISNDTLFIDCIRDNKVYSNLIEKRKLATSKLKKQKSNLDFFSNQLDEILSGTIEYKHIENSLLGLSYSTKISGSLLPEYKFYKSIIDVFKEYYVNSESNISDENLIDINNALKEIENIDKHIWQIKYYIEEEKKHNEITSKEARSRQKIEKLDRLTK